MSSSKKVTPAKDGTFEYQMTKMSKVKVEVLKLEEKVTNKFKVLDLMLKNLTSTSTSTSTTTTTIISEENQVQISEETQESKDDRFHKATRVRDLLGLCEKYSSSAKYSFCQKGNPDEIVLSSEEEAKEFEEEIDLEEHGDSCLKGWFLHIVPKQVEDCAKLMIGNYTISLCLTGGEKEREDHNLVEVVIKRNDFQGHSGLLSAIEGRIKVAHDGTSLSIVHCAQQDVIVHVENAVISYLTREDLQKQFDEIRLKNKMINYLKKFGCTRWFDYDDDDDVEAVCKSRDDDGDDENMKDFLAKKLEDVDFSKHPQTTNNFGGIFLKDNDRLGKLEKKCEDNDVHSIFNVECDSPILGKVDENLYQTFSDGIKVCGGIVRVQLVEGDMVVHLERNWVEERTINCFFKIDPTGELSYFAKVGESLAVFKDADMKKLGAIS